MPANHPDRAPGAPANHPDRAPRALALAFAALLLLGGCSMFAPPVQQHGIIVDKDDLDQLVIGTSTRNDVVAAIGSPTMKASFDENTWIYISERTYLRIMRTTGMDNLKVLTLTFDDKGILRGIKRIDDKDQQPVSIVSATTPSPGTEVSFMQQLLGNIGKVNPGLGDTNAPGGIGPSGGGLTGMH